MTINYDQGLRMATHMKARGDEIKQAILKCQAADHGVVALRFSDLGRDMSIEILDEPYDDNVRVYPG